MVDFLPSAEQQQVIDSVADFLSANLPVSRLRPGAVNPPREADLWSRIADLGWFGLALPESSGGAKAFFMRGVCTTTFADRSPGSRPPPSARRGGLLTRRRPSMADPGSQRKNDSP